MPPFRKSEHIFLVTSFFGRIRWRYCRSCGRHFITAAKRRRGNGGSSNSGDGTG